MNAQIETPAPPPPPRNNRKTWIIIGSILGILALCVCVVAVVVGAVLGYQYYTENGGFTPSPAVGTWALTFDWGCTGSGQTGHFYIQDDGSFTDDDSSVGRWVLSGGQINLTYDGGTAYVGTLAQAHITGTMVAFDGATGCWSANRTTP